MQKITLIAAMAKNHCIGLNNTIPWHIPEDFAFFKQYTLGKPIIMGRKTWDSLPIKPLPLRRNIVISRQQNWQATGAELAGSIDEALHKCQTEEEIIIIGGAQIYRETLPLATDLRITEVNLSVMGDAFFPEWNIHKQWKEINRSHHVSSKNSINFDLVHWVRE